MIEKHRDWHPLKITTFHIQRIVWAITWERQIADCVTKMLQYTRRRHDFIVAISALHSTQHITCYWSIFWYICKTKTKLRMLIKIVTDWQRQSGVCGLEHKLTLVFRFLFLFYCASKIKRRVWKRNHLENLAYVPAVECLFLFGLEIPRRNVNYAEECIENYANRTKKNTETHRKRNFDPTNAHDVHFG